MYWVMKKKMPFDISYRDRIESGEVNVVTGCGEPAEIVKWDCKGRYPILAIIAAIDTSDSRFVPEFFAEDGTSEHKNSWLCILIGDDELTEFEALVKGLMTGVRNGLTNSFKDEAAILLEAARKALRPEFDKELEQAYKNRDDVVFRKGYEKGFLAGSEIDEERLTDKIAEKVAEKVVKDGNPFIPAVPGRLWPDPIRPYEPITVMYGVTPTEFRPTAADQVSGESSSTATSIKSED